MSYNEWIKTVEGKQWLQKRSKYMKNNNPMFNKETVKKMVSHTNYIETGKKISKTRIQRIKEGKIKVVSMSKKARKRMSLSMLGEKNHNWKGDNIEVHSWIKRYKPQPILCECCNKRKSYDLANISGKYKRQLNDWEWLCRSCHMKKDGRLKKFQSLIRTPIRGSKHPFSKLNEEDIHKIRKLLKKSTHHKDIAKKYNVTIGAITAINLNKNWKWLK